MLTRLASSLFTAPTGAVVNQPGSVLEGMDGWNKSTHAKSGLIDKVLVLVCSEFSRTPRMNDGGNGGPPMSMGTPGRDHWGNAISILAAGAGVKGGRVIGSTNRLGEVPKDRPLTPSDLHHTMFHVLGVDRDAQFINHSGRPVAALEPGEVIQDLF